MLPGYEWSSGAAHAANSRDGAAEATGGVLWAGTVPMGRVGASAKPSSRVESTSNRTKPVARAARLCVHVWLR